MFLGFGGSSGICGVTRNPTSHCGFADLRDFGVVGDNTVTQFQPTSAEVCK